MSMFWWLNLTIITFVVIVTGLMKNIVDILGSFEMDRKEIDDFIRIVLGLAVVGSATILIVITGIVGIMLYHLINHFS
jgi:hypothetical protein